MMLSVVMPVYNEAETIEEIVRRVLAVPLKKELVIVDDGSTDGTREKLAKLKTDNVKVIFHDRNAGKGAALRTGFAAASGDIVMIQDADLEYDPADYMKMLDPIVDGRADIVYGSRFLSGPHRVLYFWHYIGNKALTLLSNMLSNLNLTDMETCYKAFKRDVIKTMNFKSNRFGFEPEFTVKAARRGFRVYEVPISYSGRTYAEGKKIGWKDGVSAVWAILRYRLFE